MSDDQVVLTLTMEQIVKSGLPFNPVADVSGQGVPFSGQNVTRMMDFMGKNRMDDPRFVSVEEARFRGWEVNGSALTVSTVHRDPTNGSVGEKFWVNARDVVGMPTLESMQKTAKFYRLNQGALPKIAMAELAPVVLVPARGTELEDLHEKSNLARAALEAGTEVEAKARRFTVMAPYWINGVHNVAGIRLAEEISGLVHTRGWKKRKMQLRRC